MAPITTAAWLLLFTTSSSHAANKKPLIRRRRQVSSSQYSHSSFRRNGRSEFLIRRDWGNDDVDDCPPLPKTCDTSLQSDVCGLHTSCATTCMPAFCKIPRPSNTKVHAHHQDDRYVKLGSVCGAMRYVEGHVRAREEAARHDVQVCCLAHEQERHDDDEEDGSCVTCNSCLVPQRVNDVCCKIALDSTREEEAREGSYTPYCDGGKDCCKCGSGNGPESYVCIDKNEACSTSLCPGTTTSTTTLASAMTTGGGTTTITTSGASTTDSSMTSTSTSDGGDTTTITTTSNASVSSTTSTTASNSTISSSTATTDPTTDPTITTLSSSTFTSTTSDPPTTTNTSPSTSTTTTSSSTSTTTGTTSTSTTTSSTTTTTMTEPTTTTSTTSPRGPCVPNPCQNGATCILGDFGFSCQCAEGTMGTKCEIELPATTLPCVPNPCQNSGTCVGEDGSYTCECPVGFEGDDCEIDLPCVPDPCQNGGTCVEENESYSCDCLPGFEGENCAVAQPCELDPCLNGGTCVEENESYTCECPVGFSGKNCQIEQPCELDPCQNGGTCVKDGESYTCECPVGFDGNNCQIDLPCIPNPCLNGGTCVRDDGSYTCQCPDGFGGENCEIDLPCIPNPCRNGGTCVKDGGSYTCACPTGFGGINCEIEQPCQPNPCRNGGICSDMRDMKFECQCTGGYSGPTCNSCVSSQLDYILVGDTNVFGGAGTDAEGARIACIDSNDGGYNANNVQLLNELADFATKDCSGLEKILVDIRYSAFNSGTELTDNVKEEYALGIQAALPSGSTDINSDDVEPFVLSFPGTLDPYKTVVFYSPVGITSAEQAALHDFMLAGGRVMFILDGALSNQSAGEINSMIATVWGGQALFGGVRQNFVGTNAARAIPNVEQGITANDICLSDGRNIDERGVILARYKGGSRKPLIVGDNVAAVR